MLAACLCCRKKVPKNDLLGLEGMVKIKNPDDQIVITNGVADISIDPNVSAGSAGDGNEKRVSNAPHRSLPDIPVSEPLPPGPGDTGSDLYATVGDKVVHDKFPTERNPNHAIRKLASISQHSSISQADDVSSPYARVKSPANHAYDKLRTTEHPYAQVTAANHSSSIAASTSGSANATTGTLGNGSISATLSSIAQLNADETSSVDGPSRRGSNESLLGGAGSHEDIPAASAIAGRVSASQELPYMTPPIVQQPIHTQHFSGDSQDSSKGYTSISVREPLANIIAQTNQNNAAAQQRRRDLSDSHYATVSDDSDEMYAAIEDPNQQHADLYTSGSETYAQIQPPPPNPNAITVAVEINNTATTAAPAVAVLSRNVIVEDDVMLSSVTSASSKRQSVISGPPIDETPVPPNVDSLRTVHSRQASSSSCTSSVGNLGSPKPEKRQANSPLPPTPKNSTLGTTTHHHHLSNTNLASLNGGIASIPSSRNSVASVIESQLTVSGASRHVSRENLTGADGLSIGSSRNSAALGSQLRLSMGEAKHDDDAAKKRSSAKNLEGMYAKVMKKNKLSNAPSPNTSPVPHRKSYNEDLLLMAASATGASNPDLNALKPISDTISAGAAALSKSMIVPKSANDYETIDQRRSHGGGGYDDDTRDPEYETIPADAIEVATNFALTIFAELDRSASTPTPHSLSVSPRILVNSSEPGYESLPDRNQRNQDPGYETVKPAASSTSVVHRNSVTASDYDPNYEVLRHNSTGSRHEGNYAHVWDPSSAAINDPSAATSTTIDGYTKVKRTDSSVSSTNSIDFHDYAKITDRPQRSFVLSSSDCIAERDDEDDNLSSDIYASISTVVETKNAADPSPLFLNLGQSDPNYSTISETRTGAPTSSSVGPVTSPLSVSSPGPSSTSKTTPSSDSSLTPIDYTSMRNSTSTTTTITLDDDRLLTTIGTTYESLTGSESDPNYESVRYAESGAPIRPENPYERLFGNKTVTADTSEPPSDPTNPPVVEVGDYFHV